MYVCWHKWKSELEAVRREGEPWFECSTDIRCLAPLSQHRNCSFQLARRFSSSSCLSLLPSLSRFLVSHKQPQGLEAYRVTLESSNRIPICASTITKLVSEIKKWWLKAQAYVVCECYKQYEEVPFSQKYIERTEKQSLWELTGFHKKTFHFKFSHLK